MKRFLYGLGFCWALPISIFSFVLAILLVIFNQIRSVHMRKDFIVVWNLKNDGWFYKRFFEDRGWIGYSCGSNIFVREETEPSCGGLAVLCFGWILQQQQKASERYDKLIRHESRHCVQQYVLGIFFPVVYIIISIIIWICAKDNHAYYDNPFEIDARRYAGQRAHFDNKRWTLGPYDRWPWW